MVIQLNFENPHEISASDISNKLSVEVKDNEVFTRKSDGFSVPYKTVVQEKLPKFGSLDVVAAGQ